MTVKNKFLWGLALIGAILGYKVGTHYYNAGGAKTPPQEVYTVAVNTMDVQHLNPLLTLHGYAKAHSIVKLNAETKGEILSFDIKQGARVNKGTVLATLSIEDRDEALQEAQARLTEAKKRFDIEKELKAKNFSSELSFMQAKTNLESAEAAHSRIQTDFNNTKIVAPFDGVVLKHHTDIGNKLRGGEPVISFADLKTLKVIVNLAEKNYSDIKQGQTAAVTFQNGVIKEGLVTFMSRSADPKTRSYELEITVDNEDEALPDGITAEVSLPTPKRPIYKIAPSSLTLDDKGRMGVKVVNDANKVVFHPTTYVMSEGNLIWVTGLPNKIRLIAYGADFVEIGEEVQTKELNPQGS